MSDESEDEEWALKKSKPETGGDPTSPAEVPPPPTPSEGTAERGPDSGLLRAEKQTTRRLQSIGGTKIAILGATMSGKSYLFQAMTYRVSNPARSGSLKVFLGNEQGEIYEAVGPDEDFRMLDMRAFNGVYKQWGRLPSTNVAAQRWYKLLLRYRTGFFGLRRAEMCIDFLDGSGEAMQQKIALMQPAVLEMFKSAYLPARVAIFCLPMWAAFPDPELRAGMEVDIKVALDGFYQIVHNFKKLREDHGIRHPVQSILALTQADDRRCALRDMRRFWIDPFVHRAAERARELGTQRGMMRYLRDARAVSDWLVERFQRSERNDIQKMPFEVQFDGHLPMVVPPSAIDGSTLDLHSPGAFSPTPTPSPVFPGAPPPRREQMSMVINESDPVPVHVELPLLFALCDQHNALL